MLMIFSFPSQVLKFKNLYSFRVIGFAHRKSVLPCIPNVNDCPENLTIHVNLEKSSSSAVYEYFSAKHADITTPDVSWN